MSRIAASLVILVLTAAFAPSSGAVTLDELVTKAKGAYAPLKAQTYSTQAADRRAEAALDPYWPTLTWSFSYDRYLESTISPANDDKSQYGTAVRLSYRLLDMARSPQKESARYAALAAQSSLGAAERDLVRLVKDLYVRIVAGKMFVATREGAVYAANQIMDLANAKREVGLAKRSDVSQAQVRLDQERSSLISRKGDLAKLVDEMASIAGMPLAADDFDEPTLPRLTLSFDSTLLEQAALERRDEIAREQRKLKAAEEDRLNVRSVLYPRIDAGVSYRRADDSFVPGKDESAVGLTFSWTLFDGFGRYRRSDAAGLDIAAQQASLDEIRRTVRLDVRKAWQDMRTGIEKSDAADSAFVAAKDTYEQAFEEYRIGKGDMLTLLQSQINLADARDGIVSARLALHQARIALERAAGLTRLEELQ